MPAASTAPESRLQCTLVLPQDASGTRILLGKKATGMGAGFWCGFGGKLEAGETILACAEREMREETGVDVAGRLEKRGCCCYTFGVKPGFYLEVHVFSTCGVSGIPALCEEFVPGAVWYQHAAIPFAEMWKDFALWWPLFAAGDRFMARVHYGDYYTVLEERVERVGMEASLEAMPGWQ